jgi:hypothetical protein
MPDAPPAAMEDSEGVQGGPEGPSGDPVVEADPQTGGEPGANPQHEPDEDADEVLQPGKDTIDDPNAHAQGEGRPGD